jgi:hypothetical protein
MIVIDGFATAAPDLQLIYRAARQQSITERATQVGKF